jgi:hypothetical protein
MKSYIYIDRIGLDDLRMVEQPDPTPGPHVAMAGSRAGFEMMARA